MDCRIRGIDELPGNEAAFDLGREFVRFFDSAGHTLRAIGQHDLGPICLDEITSLDAHRFWHGQNELVTTSCRNRSQSDSRISRGWLDNGRSRLQDAYCFGIIDHRFRNTVLDRARWIEILELS